MLNLPTGSSFAALKAKAVPAKRLPSATFLVHRPSPMKNFRESASSMMMFMDGQVSTLSGTTRILKRIIFLPRNLELTFNTEDATAELNGCRACIAGPARDESIVEPAQRKIGKRNEGNGTQSQASPSKNQQ